MAVARHNPEGSGELPDVVRAVGAQVTSGEIDVYREWREIEDKSYKLHCVLDAWERQQTQERGLRMSYAKWLLVFLFVQSVAANAAFFLIGREWLVVEQWVAQTFIVGVFGEISAMSFVVIRYLFAKGQSGLPRSIEKL